METTVHLHAYVLPYHVQGLLSISSLANLESQSFSALFDKRLHLPVNSHKSRNITSLLVFNNTELTMCLVSWYLYVCKTARHHSSRGETTGEEGLGRGPFSPVASPPEL